MNVLQIREDIYFNAKINSSTFTGAEILKYINDGYREAQMLIRGINENYFLVYDTTTLQLSSVNDSSYTYPDDCEKVVQLQVALQPADSSSPLSSEFQVCNFISQSQIQNPNVTFSRPHAVAFGDYFVLYPTLVNTSATTYPVTNGMKIYYIQRLAELTSDTDVPNFNKDYHQYITWYVVDILCNRLNKTTLRDNARLKKKEWAENLTRYISGREMDMQGLILEGQSGNFGWDYPFGNYGY